MSNCTCTIGQFQATVSEFQFLIVNDHDLSPLWAHMYTFVG